jgi:hypothetical protein
VSIGEEEYVDFYWNQGFGGEVFDVNGFNAEGLYYMDINEDWQGAKDPISMYAANRIMRDNILAQIPRYSQWPTRSSSS